MAICLLLFTEVHRPSPPNILAPQQETKEYPLIAFHLCITGEVYIMSQPSMVMLPHVAHKIHIENLPFCKTPTPDGPDPNRHQGWERERGRDLPWL